MVVTASANWSSACRSADTMAVSGGPAGGPPSAASRSCTRTASLQMRGASSCRRVSTLRGSYSWAKRCLVGLAVSCPAPQAAAARAVSHVMHGASTYRQESWPRTLSRRLDGDCSTPQAAAAHALRHSERVAPAPAGTAIEGRARLEAQAARLAVLKLAASQGAPYANMELHAVRCPGPHRAAYAQLRSLRIFAFFFTPQCLTWLAWASLPLIEAGASCVRIAEACMPCAWLRVMCCRGTVQAPGTQGYHASFLLTSPVTTKHLQPDETRLLYLMLQQLACRCPEQAVLGYRRQQSWSARRQRAPAMLQRGWRTALPAQPAPARPLPSRCAPQLSG
jgi:hypothetical protein